MSIYSTPAQCAPDINAYICQKYTIFHVHLSPAIPNFVRGLSPKQNTEEKSHPLSTVVQDTQICASCKFPFLPATVSHRITHVLFIVIQSTRKIRTSVPRVYVDRLSNIDACMCQHTCCLPKDHVCLRFFNRTVVIGYHPAVFWVHADQKDIQNLAPQSSWPLHFSLAIDNVPVKRVTGI
jgi:hypothetical protein